MAAGRIWKLQKKWYYKLKILGMIESVQIPVVLRSAKIPKKVFWGAKETFCRAKTSEFHQLV